MQFPNKPTAYKILLSGHINPFLFNQMRRGNGWEVTITEPRRIELGSSVFNIPEQAPDLRIGETAFLVQTAYESVLKYKSDIEKYDADYKEYWAWKSEQIRIEQQAKQAEKERVKAQFFALYAIPFRFATDIKEVLSGLSANSSGDGRKKNSVEHIVCLEAVRDGRTVRKAGDFLCAPVQGRWGGNWSHTAGDWTEKQIITCKACLAKMEKYKK